MFLPVVRVFQSKGSDLVEMYRVKNVKTSWRISLYRIEDANAKLSSEQYQNTYDLIDLSECILEVR